MLRTIRSQRDFCDVKNQGQKWITPSFIIQATLRKRDSLSFERECQEQEKTSFPELSFGFIVTKKTFRKAVHRNRVRRRLKEAVRAVLKTQFSMNQIMGRVVFVVRRNMLSEDFEDVVAAVKKSLIILVRKCTSQGKKPAHYAAVNKIDGKPS
jgi:ribonuclease P protein component